MSLRGPSWSSLLMLLLFQSHQLARLLEQTTKLASYRLSLDLNNQAIDFNAYFTRQIKHAAVQMEVYLKTY